MPKKKLALIILDGWGYSENPKNNAILNAHTPNMDRLWQNDCHGLISGSGTDVGLPTGQMGNSEVGHLNLGAGRVVDQDFSRITKAINDGSFQNNPVLVSALEAVQINHSSLHIMGLLSDGGVHSHQDHIHAMIKMAADFGLQKIYLHAFLDGRDTPPQSALKYIEEAEALFKKIGVGKIASITGRYYAMDRDNRWDRIEKAYDMLTCSKSDYHFDTAEQGLSAAYQRDENDEFVFPTIIGEDAPIVDKDAVIFMNFRADRAREITRAFNDEILLGFERIKQPALSKFVMLTQYADDIKASIAYPQLKLHNVIGEYISNLDLKQLRIAETEKYAHVTFFFSGGVEEPFDGEERLLIPSPQVATYDLQPQMNAPLLTEKLTQAIESTKYDLIVCNFANADMVGHTGNYDAAVAAIEALDVCIGKIIESLDKVNGECIITADHGNAEKMYDDDTSQSHTAHTSQPVPFIYHGRPAKMIISDGVLSDIAPTILYLMGLDIPSEMTGRILVKI